MLVLTSTMIVGIAVLVVLFATRFPGKTPAPATEFSLPDTLELPADATVQAITRGQDWWAVVVTDASGAQEILILDADGGLRQTVALDD